MSGGPVAPSRGALEPLGVADVRIDPGFWGHRQRLNGEVILDHCLGWMERLGWVENFRAAATGRLPEARRGREFSDADVYKLVEAMWWEEARTGGGYLAPIVETLSEAIAGAQHPDGYLNTMFGSGGPTGRYRDLEWGHELYCYGHLLQAAVARHRSVEPADDVLVAVARRAADHVCREFGPDGRQGVDGHPEIETALVELYRVTGEERYLEQARLFVERRGGPALADVELGRAYFQDDLPVRAARSFRGHAVRALYLASGVVDVAVETGDQELLSAVADQWARTVATRTYLTGGMGSRHRDEAFGGDYELPPDRAYAETCAGVASVQLAWRLLLATGEARYADLIERTLFNVVAAAVARDGRAFFYTNPLQVRSAPPAPDPEVESPRAQAGMRAAWFTTACCPPNVARLLATLSAYVATSDRTGVQVHQLVPGEVSCRLADGSSVRLRMETDYPWSGRVAVRVDATPVTETPWRLAVRIPPWAGGATAVVQGTSGATSFVTSERYAVAERLWRPGDELRLELPMGPRWTYPDPRVDAIRGTVAVERGPLVYCAESLAGGLDVLEVDDSGDPFDLGHEPALDGAMTVGVTATDRVTPAGGQWPYGSRPEVTSGRPRTQQLIPYFAWGNRGPATMRVWLPLASSYRRPAENL